MTLLPKEEDEQKVLVQYLEAKRLFYFAPANENKFSGIIRATLIALLGKGRGTTTATKVIALIQRSLNALGVRKGVSDLVIFLPTKILFIELKRQKVTLKNGNKSSSNSRVSIEQRVFIDKVGEYPYAEGYIAYGAKEAISIIEKEMIK